MYQTTSCLCAYLFLLGCHCHCRLIVLATRPSTNRWPISCLAPPLPVVIINASMLGFSLFNSLVWEVSFGWESRVGGRCSVLLSWLFPLGGRLMFFGFFICEVSSFFSSFRLWDSFTSFYSVGAFTSSFYFQLTGGLVSFFLSLYPPDLTWWECCDCVARSVRTDRKL